MTALPASPFQPYTLYVYHREIPDGVTCVCGYGGGDDPIRQVTSTGLPGLIPYMLEEQAAVDDESDCADRYEAQGPEIAGDQRSYP